MGKRYFVSTAALVFAFVLLGPAAASAYGMFGFKMGGLTPEQIAQSHQEMFQQQANLLGINAADVKAAWAQGKTLRQMAEEKGITAEQFKQKLLAQKVQRMKDSLKVLVDKGVITQAQADQRLQIMQSSIQRKQGWGHRGMMRGMMGFGF